MEITSHSLFLWNSPSDSRMLTALCKRVKTSGIIESKPNQI